MQQELFEIANPCIQVCEMDNHGYCIGCLRNRTERALWFNMDDAQKRQVLRLLAIRKIKKSKTQSIAFENMTNKVSNDNNNLTLFEDNGNNGTDERH